jgi:hypothetical protein
VKIVLLFVEVVVQTRALGKTAIALVAWVDAGYFF